MRRALRYGALICALPVAAMAMGLFGGSRPTDVVLENASHISTPIVIERLDINGAKYVAGPSVANTSWMNPRGGDTTTGSLPWPAGRDEQVLIESAWVDVESGQGFDVAVELPWQSFRVDRTVNARLEVVAVYGLNGEFKVVTGADPDPQTGQYNGKEIHVVCGTRAPELDKDYTTPPGQPPGLERLLSLQEEPVASNLPQTSCPGGES